MNRAKIVATLGPATANEKALKAIILTGANVIRINLSHGSEEEHRKNIRLVRKVADDLGYPVAVLADVQGPKLRTGLLKGHKPVMLDEGATVELTTRIKEGDKDTITTDYPELIQALEAGATILINDGRIKLEVLKVVSKETLKCKVIEGGELSEKKGINVPQAALILQALTDKDKKDVAFCLDEGVDYLAQSFVRCAEDVEALKALVKKNLAKNGKKHFPRLIAKIEKPQALADIDNILAVADGLMVARGDLGVELSLPQVPVVQKQLIDKANLAEKPVIVATQMLESLITSFQPTRAEVSDVANAVFDGADALMLSGETAVGEHPVEAVRLMREIIETAEKDFEWFQHIPHEESDIHSPHFYHAIAHSAGYASRKANVKAIVVLSTSGSMAQRVSKLKPQREVIALTPDKNVYNAMSLLWGITPLVIPYAETTDETLARGEAAILEKKLLKKGDSVLFCAGQTPLKGASNMLKIYELGK